MSKVLILAHDFPPIAGGGVPRPLSFAKYLPQFGYVPIVLTRGSTCGRPVDLEPLDQLPSEVIIERIDPDPDEWEHLRQRLSWVRPMEQLLGKPANWLADGLAWRAAQRNPAAAINRTWIEPAVALGAELIRRHRPSALIATGPPFATLKIGCILAERFDLPLVTDYRDPWTYGYLWNPVSGRYARDERQWEERVLARSDRVLVVTPSMAARLREDYPAHADKVDILTNGYDDDAEPTDSGHRNKKFTITHVGTFSGFRQPTMLLEAASRLRDRHPEVAAELCIQFVGNASPPLAPTLDRLGLNGLVDDVGFVSASQSRDYMRSADMLLLYEFVGTIAIPGKCYEYLAAGRPILALVKEESDAAWLLRQTSLARIVGEEDPDLVVDALVETWRAWRAGNLQGNVDPKWLSQFHRRTLTKTLAAFLRQAADTNVPAVC